MALSNEQLTAQLQTLQAGMMTVEQTLEGMIPNMEASIKESKALITEINQKLISHINPIIEADLISIVQKLDQHHRELAKTADERASRANEAFTKLREIESATVGIKTVTDQSIGEMRTFSNRVDSVAAQVVALRNELAGEKNTNDARYASTQSQIAVATSMQPSSSGSSGGRPKEPLVTHKLMLNKTALTGEEDYDSFDEWYSDMLDDFEILMAGSKQIMVEAEKDQSPITMTRLLSHSSPQLATQVSRELYSVLKKKTTGQARSQLKALGENEGLEAWRLIRANRC